MMSAVLLPELDRRMAGAGHVLGFVLKRPIISIRHAIDIEAQDFAGGGHDINAIADTAGEEQTPSFCSP